MSNLEPLSENDSVEEKPNRSAEDQIEFHSKNIDRVSKAFSPYWTARTELAKAMISLSAGILAIVFAAVRLSANPQAPLQYSELILIAILLLAIGLLASIGCLYLQFDQWSVFKDWFTQGANLTGAESDVSDRKDRLNHALQRLDPKDDPAHHCLQLSIGAIGVAVMLLTIIAIVLILQSSV